MIQLENPPLPCADAGPVSAALSKNPMPHHACGGIMGHQMAKSCWVNKPANADLSPLQLALTAATNLRPSYRSQTLN